jgi:sugar transferase (PEP-CTERM system associated)
LLGCETALVVAALATSSYVQLGPGGAWRAFFEGNGLARALLVAAVCELSLYALDFYDLRALGGWRDVLARLLRALGIASLSLAVLYLCFPALIIESRVVSGAAGLIALSLAGSRTVFDWFSRHAPARERILIVGMTQAALALAGEIAEGRRASGVEVVGFVSGDPNDGDGATDARVVGTIEDIPAVVRARAVDRVVISLADSRGQLPLDKLLDLRISHGIRFADLATAYEEYMGKIAVENLRPSLLIYSDGFQTRRLSRTVKRLCDIGLGSLALVVFSPLMLIIAVLIKSTSAGPVVYRQPRVGRFGRIFTIRKFRSMRVDEAGTAAVWARRDDHRVTPLGRALRRARLDELPQLLNVIAGDMSLVGPRPERPEFVGMLTERIPFYGERHVIRPGLTGWAQIRYTYRATVEDAMEKLQYDLFYIKHLSVIFDFVILFRTVKTVLQQRGAE